MGKLIAATMLAGVALVGSGCLPSRRPLEPQQLSLKDDVSRPPKAAVEAPPKPKPTFAIEDRARSEQWQRCAQRHVDYQAGRLNETAEQKHLMDEICAELHRTDHARD